MNKKYLAIILTVVLILIGVIWFLIARKKIFINQSMTPTSTTAVQTSQERQIRKQQIDKQMVEIQNQMNEKQKLDSDLDGLSNEEEKQLGTNPNNIDTDGDGLTDYEEVSIYHTNPLNADTDGDGFNDGIEVRRGYNPLGPGKLK